MEYRYSLGRVKNIGKVSVESRYSVGILSW